MFGEKRGELAMDAAGAGATLGLFVLELVELAEDLQRNADMVVAEAVEAVRVVKEDVGIEDEVLSDGRGGLEAVPVKGLSLLFLFGFPLWSSMDDEHLGLEGTVERTVRDGLGGGIGHNF
jgi:hypothetical protein